MLALLAGLLYCAAQPPLGASAVAWVALVPLLVAVRGSGTIGAFLLGWVAGTIACNGLTSASIFAALVRAGHPAWLAVAESAVVPQLLGAVYFGAFGAYAALVERWGIGPAFRLLALPSAWVAGEFARARLGHGMPWVLLAHSQVGYPSVLQVADLAGAYGVSFVVAVVNVLVATLAARPPGGRPLHASLALAAIIVGATLLYGQVQLRRWSAPAGRSLDVALVQGAVPDAWRTALPGVARAVARYHRLVVQAAATRPDLVVLPENAISVSAAANPELLAEVARGLDANAALLVGGPRDVRLGPGRATVRNSAYLLDGGAVRAVYDKVHLVPFGESPTWLLPGFVQRRLGLADDYSAGETAAPFAAAGTRIGTVICWEGIYPETIRALVRSGAELLVNLSNDDWFGRHAAREQHFRATLLRAVESRRFLLRATNSGETAIVDPRGVVLARAPTDAPAVLPGRVTPATALTVYTRAGDAFAWSCVAWAFAAAAIVRRKLSW